MASKQERRNGGIAFLCMSSIYFGRMDGCTYAAILGAGMHSVGVTRRVKVDF
jgi:hypothetical protein